MTHPIYPYKPPRELAPNLWQIRGSLPMPVPRNMTVHRLADGRLALYSVVAMYEDGMRALEALGEPAIMVIPHDRHHMDAPFYKARYPALRVLAPHSRAVRGVAIDGDISELTGLGVKAYAVPGSSYHDVALEVPLEGGGCALVVCEILTNLDPPGGLMRVMFKLLGPPGGGFGVARAVRLREAVDRAGLGEWLAGLAARGDVRMVLVGHGDALLRKVSAELLRAARQV